MNIGNWIRRRKGKWHLVESLIEGDAITRCGRRMDRVLAGVHDSLANRTLQVSGVMPLTRAIGQPQNCRLCDIESINGRLAPEDDASTAPVDPVTDTP